jgi:hypothetical protein
LPSNFPWPWIINNPHKVAYGILKGLFSRIMERSIVSYGIRHLVPFQIVPCLWTPLKKFMSMLDDQHQHSCHIHVSMVLSSTIFCALFKSFFNRWRIRCVSSLFMWFLLISSSFVQFLQSTLIRLLICLHLFVNNQLISKSSLLFMK